jgi:hypothetical protein
MEPLTLLCCASAFSSLPLSSLSSLLSSLESSCFLFGVAAVGTAGFLAAEVGGLALSSSEDSSESSELDSAFLAGVCFAAS